MEINWYAVVVFLHVVGAFIFVMAHGTSALMAFKLRDEKNIERIRALLDLSASSYGVMYGGLLLLLIAGIVAGFMGNLWGRGWLWTSLVVLIVTAVLMSVRGSAYYGMLRKAVGLPYFEKGKIQPAVASLSEGEVLPMLQSGRALEVATIGGLGFILMLWLMMFKPF